MRAKWGWVGWLGIVGVFLAGCRSSQPDLKPTTTAEVLTKPPENVQYTSYPKAAFNTDDPFKRSGTAGQAAQTIMPTRGGMSGPGPGMGPGR